MKTEIWKDVPGFEGIFEVSNMGRVKSYPRNGTDGGMLIGYTNKLGYRRVLLRSNNIRKYIFVHRLVASVFIPNPMNLPIINHKDENPSNNWDDNLEWCTVKYNTNYGGCLKKRSKTRTGYKHTSVAREKMSKTCIERAKRGILSPYSKAVYQFDLNGLFIKRWGAVTDVTRELGYSHSLISRAANGILKTAKGYTWSYDAPSQISGIL